VSFKEQLKEYFSFTKGESQGIIILLILLFFAIIINIFSDYFIAEPEFDFSKYKKLLTELQDSTNVNKDVIKKYDTLHLFKFNPNNLTSEQAKRLGLSEYQYAMIDKYLSAGGKFKNKSDFGKIYSIYEEQFQLLYPYIDLPKKNNSERNKTEYAPEKQTVEYFDFNPNTLNDEGWMKLGFSQKQVEIIRKYVDKGGIFLKKEDLKKLYVIDETKYADLEPYIRIEETKNKSEKTGEHTKVDINNLSADEMKKYGRFWQYNAERIVKYRNLLGGFYKKEQLLEVYGVKKQYYDKIANDIIIDKSKPEKINVNFAEVSELGRHPYISWQNAEKIIEFRNKNGFIKDLKILKEKKIIPANIYEKISPYLKVK